jgi:hypothetical protein
MDSLHKKILQNYFTHLRSITLAAETRRECSPVFPDLPQDPLSATEVALLLRDVRIFEFQSEDYRQSYLNAITYVHQVLMQMHLTDYNDAKGGLVVPAHLYDSNDAPIAFCFGFTDDCFKKEMDKRYARTYPTYPIWLPFKASYIAWGGGCPKYRTNYKENPPSKGVFRVNRLDVRGFERCTLEAFVVTDNVAFTLSTCNDPKHGQTVDMETLYRGGKWLCASEQAWVMCAAIGLIERHDTLIAGTKHLSDRLLAQRTAKEMRRKVLPPPYYRVRLHTVTHDAFKAYRKLARKRMLHYRHDVRAHRVTYVRSGTLPLKPEQILQYRQRRYMIYTIFNPPSGEALEILLRHRVSMPTITTYVAILVTRRRAYIRGPEDKPYIPSTRIPDLRLRQKG